MTGLPAPGVAADLVVSDLTVEYPASDYVVRPLDHFAMKADDGSLTLLLGPSGCGKTSLLSALGAMLTPAAGSIRLGDLEVTSLRGDALARYRRHGRRHRVPGLQPRAQPRRRRERHGAPARRGRAPARRHGPRRWPCSNGWGWASASTIVRATSRAASSSAWPSPGRWPTTRPSSWPTSRPPTSTTCRSKGVLRIIRDLAQPGRVVVVSTHDDRMLPLADQVVELRPALPANLVEPEARVELAAGETLFAQGDFGDLIFLVESGAIELFRVRPDGSEEPLRDAQPGEYFGEMGPTFKLPRAASARARTASVVIGRTVQEFRNRRHSEQLGRDVP